jgi:hypothetical protein
MYDRIANKNDREIIILIFLRAGYVWQSENDVNNAIIRIA